MITCGGTCSSTLFENTTSIELFDFGDNSLGTFFAPNVVGANETFSFLGVSYAAEATSFGSVDPAFLIPGQCTSNCFRSNLGLDLNH